MYQKLLALTYAAQATVDLASRTAITPQDAACEYPNVLHMSRPTSLTLAFGPESPRR
jgi:hypothetical protein